MPLWLTVLERLVVDAAAIATVVAVIIALKALRDSEHTARALNESLDIARAERAESTRARAALVLQHADLLAARLKSIWHDGLAYNIGHPSEESLDYYLREVEQDRGFADDLLDRASRLDPELTVYAELVWRKVSGIRLALRTLRGNALPETAQLVPGQAERLRKNWLPYRRRVVEHATEAIELLGRMEKCFPTTAVMVRGLDRQEFLKKVNAEVEATAKPNVERLLQEVEQPGSTEDQ